MRNGDLKQKIAIEIQHLSLTMEMNKANRLKDNDEVKKLRFNRYLQYSEVFNRLWDMDIKLRTSLRQFYIELNDKPLIK